MTASAAVNSVLNVVFSHLGINRLEIFVDTGNRRTRIGNRMILA